MLKVMSAGALVFAASVAAMGCQGPDDETIAERASPLIGAGGATAFPGVRAYTAETGQHTAVFRETFTSNLLEARGTPFASPYGIGGGLDYGASPWGYRRHDGKEAILYADSFRHVHEVTVIGGNIDLINVYGLNAPNVAAGSSLFPAPDVIGYVRSDHQSAIVYRGENNHVIELRSNFGSQPPWLVTDLSVASSALVTASQGSAFPYVRSDGWNSIVYLASDDRIHELASTGNGTWGDWDLFTAAGAAATPRTEPWAYVRSDGWNSVVFVDSNNKMRELAYLLGGSWGLYTLPSTSATGVTGRPSGYVRADGVNAVVYLGSDASVHELSLSSNAWIDGILPTPGVSPRSQLFGHLAPANRSSVLFQGSGAGGVFHRYELSSPVGGQWGLQAF